MCYIINSYCIEFYDKISSLEFSCGRGEGLNFNDKVGGPQFASKNDMCICLYDPRIPNIDPFMNN